MVSGQAAGSKGATERATMAGATEAARGHAAGGMEQRPAYLRDEIVIMEKATDIARVPAFVSHHDDEQEARQQIAIR